MSTLQWIELGVVALLVVAAIAVYNTLIALARRCDQAAADVDVQLKQRFDLIPNLVETVKGYAGHERGALEAVIRARNATAMATTPAAQAQAESMLGGALGRLMAVVEAYPELKASANFTALHEELSDLENKIAAARRFMNNVITEYNVTREQFPAVLFATIFGFKGRETAVIAADARATIEAAPAVRF